MSKRVARALKEIGEAIDEAIERLPTDAKIEVLEELGSLASDRLEQLDNAEEADDEGTDLYDGDDE